ERDGIYTIRRGFRYATKGKSSLAIGLEQIGRARQSYPHSQHPLDRSMDAERRPNRARSDGSSLSQPNTAIKNNRSNAPKSSQHGTSPRSLFKNPGSDQLLHQRFVTLC